MSNRRFIIVFLLGSAVLLTVLLLHGWYARDVATVETRSALCTFDPGTVDRIKIKWTEKNPDVTVERDGYGEWKLVSPINAETDESVVKRLVDALTLLPPGDMLSDSELASMGRRISDFGLSPAKCKIELGAKGKTCRIAIGNPTASRAEVYARVDGVRNVFAVSGDLLSALPLSFDALRRKSLTSIPSDAISEIEFRTPGYSFVKVVRDGVKWMMVQPSVAPADSEIVLKVADALISGRVAEFAWPSSSRSLVEGDLTSEGKLRSPGLVPFALDNDGALSVTIRSKLGKTERVVFGAAASSNLVYALVQNGSAVVKIDSSLRDVCKVSGSSLRDARVFPVSGDSVKSFSVKAGDVVYVLKRSPDGIWRLDAPVSALADQKSAASFVDSVLRLKQNDLVSKEEEKLEVSLFSSTTNFPPVEVAVSLLGGLREPANLRSKVLLAIDPKSIVRIESRTAGKSQAVQYDPAKSLWMRIVGEEEEDSRVRRVNGEALENILSAFSSLEASSIETVAATADDFKRCGLHEPYCMISLDVSGPGNIRKNIILGGATASGGRFATVGGTDAIFVLSRKLVAILTESLAE